MSRHNNVHFNPSMNSQAASSGYNNRPSERVPHPFIEAMKRVSSADNSNSRSPDMSAQTAQSSAGKWKSSFQPLDKQRGSSQGEGTEKTELYDPDSPLLSDSETEMSHVHDHRHPSPNQEHNLKRQRLSPGRGCLNSRHWDSSYSESRSRSLDRPEFSPGCRPTESHRLSPGHRLPERRGYSPDVESLDRPGYGSMSGPLDQRGHSPNRFIHSSTTQRFPASYRAPMSNKGERMTSPEYRREMTTTVRLSPPRLQRGYQHPLAYVEPGLDRDPTSTKVTRNMSNAVIMNTHPITCDLCDVEVSNGQELEDHLDSKSHWDTLEHIQQGNNYDDLSIAFLQEFMLRKSHQSSRPIEDHSALQALQKNDHMTKVEMFHCAACKVFVSTSKAEVQTHITSEEHMFNTKEFKVRQRQTCLSKAETMMEELTPQFKHFLEGGSPFE
ncbi:DBIRD complex subunit ZNF326-like isoform X2 [Mugil cephalus]|uniref:DBIRD complex subunit ZNF326-like isoform X2 n=1 Tax=Mugil cephalus TaxID=48193 RepID=UPI001FB723FA|nr:DBIRD complex subunit ZNF326-like isoform X2 [Mugil cephalus]